MSDVPDATSPERSDLVALLEEIRDEVVRLRRLTAARLVAQAAVPAVMLICCSRMRRRWSPER
jgi:hypothetical protein